MVDFGQSICGQRLLVAFLANQWGKSTAGRSVSWKHFEAAARDASDGRERSRQGNTHGAIKSSATPQRLLKRLRDRRECVSEPPITRNERESEVVASLIKVVQ